jgi:DNA (cytosine-5)-methyltransferase 1
MSAYYNEIDKFAAQWLRNLIQKNLIAPGDVDERDIRDIRPNELRGYTQCHFFAGIGVWSYALRQAGWPDDRPVWTGSCPCQPFSTAGKGIGFADERHLWPAWFWLIQQHDPIAIFGEQVANASDWLELVSTDLESKGYIVGAVDTPACGFGAPHIRQRIYFSATHPNQKRLPTWYEPRKSIAAEVTSAWSEFERVHATRTWKERETESAVPVFIDGVANRVGRISGYGNAIVAPQAQAFIESYLEVSNQSL